jgi:anti-sigma B factor antagonist
MSIKANLLRDSQGNITVQMQGDFDYENSIPLRQELTQLISDHPQALIRIDMSGIDFVGSAGIGIFAETLKLLYKQRQLGLSLSNVHQDFQRVFKLYGIDQEMFEFTNIENQALPQQPASFQRRRLFEN